MKTWISVKKKTHQPISQHVTRNFPLHDIGLVNSCDFAPTDFGGVIKGELGDASGFLSGDYLQTLNHPCDALKKP